jgi:CRISPR-associated protein Csx3
MINFLDYPIEVEGHSVTLIEFVIDGDLAPAELDCDFPSIDATKGVVLSGRGPVWLYGALIHHYHVSRWLGTYDPRLGIVVVSTHHPDSPKVGTVLPFRDSRYRFLGVM